MATCLRCKFNIDCYNCVSGGRLADCFLDCNVCGGTNCVGAAAFITPEAENPGEEPLRPLYRFSAEPLGEAIDPAVARVFDWFWRWHDAPLKAQQDSLNLSGSVLVAGKPRDFTLDIRQRGEAQVYFLQVQSFGKVVLTVNPAVDGRQELQFDLQREGEDRVRSGSLRLEAQ